MADEEYDEPSEEQQQQEQTPAPAPAPLDDIVSLQHPSTRKSRWALTARAAR